MLRYRLARGGRRSSLGNRNTRLSPLLLLRESRRERLARQHARPDVELRRSRRYSSFAMDVSIPSRNRYLGILRLWTGLTEALLLLLLRWRLLVDWNAGFGLQLSLWLCLQGSGTALLEGRSLLQNTRTRPQPRPRSHSLLLRLLLGSHGKLHSCRGLTLSWSTKGLRLCLRSRLFRSTLE